MYSEIEVVGCTTEHCTAVVAAVPAAGARIVLYILACISVVQYKMLHYLEGCATGTSLNALEVGAASLLECLDAF